MSTIIFNSCTKWEQPNPFPNQPTTPGANTTPDSLKGREFVFDSLEWIDDNGFGYPACYLIDSNLFMPNRFLSVAIKYDTLNVWEGPYRYSLGVGVLFVYPEPAPLPKLQILFGKRFSLRVKFS